MPRKKVLPPRGGTVPTKAGGGNAPDRKRMKGKATLQII
jgi:hypothetical protein